MICPKITSKKPQVDNVVDLYTEQLEELAEIRNPSLSDGDLSNQVLMLRSEIEPVYIYFPWRDTWFKHVPENEFYEIKTNRNRMLINIQEQKQLRELNISLAGLSIGSALFYGLVGAGFGRNFCISDDDRFSTSNLNRVNATIFDVGRGKCDVVAERAFEMDPFINIQILKSRVHPGNIEEFFLGGSVDIVVEEIDDFQMKVLIREEAKRKGIPLIMLTNLGDQVMIDVERYDNDEHNSIFNGKVSPDLIDEIKSKKLSPELAKKFALGLVEESLITDRIAQTVEQIGVSTVGRPQLYSSVAVSGGLLPLIVRMIVVEDKLQSGRYCIDLTSFKLL